MTTTADFLRSVVELPEFGQGQYHTTFLESWMAEQATREAEPVGRTA